MVAKLTNEDVKDTESGFLTVICLSDNRIGNTAHVECKCKCGNIITARWHDIKAKIRSSCGCNKNTPKTHGMSKTKVYYVWSGMIQRCYNENAPSYRRYGGRGIGVCDRWLESFENFYEDVGDPPSKGHSLDRPNNNGDYDVENWRWATWIEQANNKCTNIMITIDNETKSMANWARDERCLVNYKTLKQRVKKGWHPEEAIFTPYIKQEHELTAYGLTMNLKDWGASEYNINSAWTLGERIRDGWELEEALETPAINGVLIEAFGESKTVHSWAKDERCSVSEGQIHKRLDMGWTPEDAISKPRQRTREKITAFDETKGIFTWASDDRCVVSYGVLKKRIKEGMDPELALTTINEKRIPAFGEEKTLTEWSRDERCNVSLSTLCTRLKNDWDIERAMTERIR